MTELTATYRVTRKSAQKLQRLINATENGSNYHGETSYAVYQVRHEDRKWFADFAAEMSEDDGEEAGGIFQGYIWADMDVVEA